MILPLLLAIGFVGVFVLLRSLPLRGWLYGLIWTLYGAGLMLTMLLLASSGSLFSVVGGK